MTKERSLGEDGQHKKNFNGTGRASGDNIGAKVSHGGSRGTPPLAHWGGSLKTKGEGSKTL